jgi:guanosine-3',5'-bis(diphosphate) 3'-pyrophosphohydrolase
MEKPPKPQSLERDFEKAVRLLCDYMPSDAKFPKPVLSHGIRVGVYLYERKYPRPIVLAGLLHDTIEDTKISESVLRKEFGETVATLVAANSKDRSILDRNARIEDMIKRCTLEGQDALIVKVADLIDNYRYFSRIGSAEGLGYCAKNTEMVFKTLPSDFRDPIFEELKKEAGKHK